jgi:hypothetical protein
LKIVEHLLWVFLLVTFMVCAEANAEAQSSNPCDNRNSLPASFFDVPPGPQGNWRASQSPDLKQVDDPLIPVVVVSVSAIQGPANRRGMRLGCGTLSNRSQKAVVAVHLRWILIREQDRGLIVQNGYTSDTVLAQGHTPVIELAIFKESSRRTDFSIINFSAVTQDLVKDGILSGDYFLTVGVYRVLFEDGSVWEAEPLLR